MITDDQKARRRNYICSSDIAAIMGVDPWKDARNVYDQKVLGVDRQAGRKAWWGNLLEDDILAGIEEWAANRWKEPFHFEPHAMEVHSNGIFAANLDGIDRVHKRIAECKTVIGQKPPFPEYVTVNGIEVQVGWGHAGTMDPDRIPFPVLLQVQWQMLVTGFDMTLVGAFRGWMDEPLGVYMIEADAGLQELISERALAFKRDHIDRRIPPAITKKQEVA